jgi:AraC-like DNA-binding protein
MSSRTLQRRLMEAGTRFEQLIDEERKRIALSALAEAATTVTKAAGLAGYGDTSAFRDAVRRWTGLAPSELRRRAGLTA